MDANTAETVLLMYLQANTNQAVRRLGSRGKLLDDAMAEVAATIGKGWYRDASMTWQYDPRREHAVPRDPHAKPPERFVDGFHQFPHGMGGSIDDPTRVLCQFCIGLYSTVEDGGCDGTDGEMLIDIVDLGQNNEHVHEGVRPHAQIKSFSPRLVLRYAHLWTLMMQRNAQTADEVRNCLLELGFVDMTKPTWHEARR